MIDYPQELKNKIAVYYERYYKSCGLRDWEKRVEDRVNEEQVEMKRAERLQCLIDRKFAASQKHFIFGAGTGGLAVVLKKEFRCDVYGIEPCKEEFEIIQEKCKEAGINLNNFKQEFGESLSFADNQFDFVHCFTVLEHVQNVEKCVSEMLRITKPGGFIYINTPNYKYPEERHYKIIFPTFLPKPFGYLYLLLRRRPLKFLKSINFITEKQLNKILFREKGIFWFRIYKPLIKEDRLRGKFVNFFKFGLGIYPQQEIIIRKRAVQTIDGFL